ncbi:hypothetical protein HPP92_025852 [Vanilla planifolia]|uniref:RING-type domain-containing protein n=1 Tax=Vanilla planifolia TaxID=51239 RepID=A0A835U9F7_VANPL|nr:hypothetical protein HPP92_025852 [Vanilla planifolia]
MQSYKENSGAGEKASSGSPNPNPNSNLNPDNSADGENSPRAGLCTPNRTPFTSLNQCDADLALARALQEQERAYMILGLNRLGGTYYVSSDGGSYVEEDELEDPDQAEEGHGSVVGSDYGEDAFDANESGIDPADFSDDEAYARALQDAEEQDIAARLMALAGLNDWGTVEHGGQDSQNQVAWEGVDPDDLSYEELVALGELVGNESRGLSVDTIASLPTVSYKSQTGEDGDSEQCVICRLEYEDGDGLVVLSCKHRYHSECINKWLQLNKVCPVCNAEVFSTGSGLS